MLLRRTVVKQIIGHIVVGCRLLVVFSRLVIEVLQIFLLLDNLLRLFQQRLRRNLRGFYLLLEEHLVVLIAECRTQQSQVVLTDYQTATRLKQFLQMAFNSIQLAGILAGLVIAQETTEQHA